MKWFISLFAVAILATTMLFSMPSTASADTISLQTLLSPMLLAETQGDQPIVHPQSSWGALKVLYRGNAPQPNSTEREQASTDQFRNGGAAPMAGTIANQTWWRGLSQGSRNEAICQTAYNHMVSLGGGFNRLSRPSGYNCKTWVQSYVVTNASRWVAAIPKSTSWCTWDSGQYVQLVGFGPAGAPISSAGRGQIVQASWGNYPHTMIIWSRDGSGVNVIDCNMDLSGGLEIHYITFSDFEATSGGCYRIYQVIGG